MQGKFCMQAGDEKQIVALAISHCSQENKHGCIMSMHMAFCEYILYDMTISQRGGFFSNSALRCRRKKAGNTCSSWLLTLSSHHFVSRNHALSCFLEVRMRRLMCMHV